MVPEGGHVVWYVIRFGSARGAVGFCDYDEVMLGTKCVESVSFTLLLCCFGAHEALSVPSGPGVVAFVGESVMVLFSLSFVVCVCCLCWCSGCCWGVDVCGCIFCVCVVMVFLM